MKPLISILFLIAALTASASPGQPYFVRSLQLTVTNLSQPALVWKASDLPANTLVNTWTDQIAGIIITSTVPIYQPMQINCGVYFDGTTFLTNESITVDGYHWIAFKQTAWNNGFMSLYLENNTAPAAFFTLDWNEVGNNHWSYAYNGGSLREEVGITPLNELCDFYSGGNAAWTNGVFSSAMGNTGHIIPKWIGGGPSSYGMIGYIYELRFYTNALTDYDLAYLHNYATNTYSVCTNTATNNSSGLVGWWKMDDASGTSVADSSGSGNNGAFVNTPIWTTGLISGALYFPYAATTNNYAGINIPNSATLNSFTQMTMAGWVYLTNDQSGPILIKKTTFDDPPALVDPYQIYDLAVGTNFFYSSFSTGLAGSRKSINPAISISPNVWHHIASVYDGTNIKGYVDAVLLTNYAAGTFTIGSNTVPTAIGRAQYNLGNASQFNGIMDDVRLYNRGLTATEITNLFNWRP